LVRLALKPTLSIPAPVATINRDGNAADIVTKGRLDPCVDIQAAQVAAAMMALVLADAKLIHRAQFRFKSY
jgi:chorismate synthase